MRKLALVGALAGLTALVGTTAGVGVAIAAPQGCNVTVVCMYRDDNYSGGGFFKNTPGGRYNLSNEGFNDQTNSWWNNAAVDAKWFFNTNQTGSSRCMGAGLGNHSLSLYDYDEASSLAIYTDNRAC
ncbi:peptidase inhibitor family I36 protein [Streptomyces sp. NPDC099050]|uniref:peptidase inhibitor family I36 protein n=1 Tax=Streptomyces sp. NPDC099050 TaxID=3366100 RepID=UPI00382102B8